MNRRQSICTLLATAGVPALAAVDTERDDATRAAAAWLALIDAGDPAAAWQAAAPMLREQLAQEDWTRAVRAVRASIGGLRNRSAPSASFTNTLPGAPDGRYAVLQYPSAFEHKAAAVETVTLQLDAGVWLAAGYFIR